MPKRNAASPQSGHRENGAYPTVQSISRAVKILGCLRDHGGSLTDIVEYCKLSKSTVHRILRALEDSKLVAHNEGDHRYYFGPLMTTLVTRSQTDNAELVTCSLYEMQRLHELLEETVNISILPALKNTIVHEIPSDHELRVAQENRLMGFIYAGATVRVLLSQFTDEQLGLILKQITLARITERTVLDKEVFKKLVDEARSQGYAVSYGEKLSGAIGVAAPLFNYSCPAAIAIIGPESRMLPRIDEFIREIRDSASVISAKLADGDGPGRSETT